MFTEVVGRGVFGEAKKSKLASKIDKAEERRREKVSMKSAPVVKTWR